MHGGTIYMPNLLPDELADELANVVPRLEAAGVLHALIGGAAVMTYGLRARTRDLDFLVGTDTSAQLRLQAELQHFGWRIEHKAAWHWRSWRGDFFFDLVFGDTDLERDVVEQATVRSLGPVLVRTATPEHLCALKLIAGRPQDLRDVAEIAEHWPELHIHDVNRWLAPYGLQWDRSSDEIVPTLRVTGGQGT
jgi:hypothetical protein